MDYKGQTRSGEKVAELRPPVTPVISPETQHAVGNLGNAAMNPGIFSPEEIVSVENPENVEAFLPAEEQGKFETSVAQAKGDATIIDFSSIKTGKQLSKEGAAQVEKINDDLGKHKIRPAAYTTEVYDMVEANIKNSYNRVLGDGPAAYKTQVYNMRDANIKNSYKRVLGEEKAA